LVRSILSIQNVTQHRVINIAVGQRRDCNWRGRSDDFDVQTFVPKKPSFHSDACSEARHVEVGGRDANLVRRRRQARVLHKIEKLKSSQPRIRIGSACPTIFGSRSFEMRAHSISVKRRQRTFRAAERDDPYSHAASNDPGNNGLSRPVFENVKQDPRGTFTFRQFSKLPKWGLLEAIKSIRQDRKAVIAYIMESFAVDQGVAEEAYDDISGVLLDDMMMAESGLNKYLEMIYGRGETNKPLTVNEIVDYSFLKSLK
jgi:hypothetical protein